MNPNSGSFGAAIAPGAGNPIMEALQRRGMGASPAIAQSSVTQIPTPAPVSQNTSSGVTGGSVADVGGGSVVAMPPQTKESELIVRALSDRLKTFSRIEEAQAIPPKPQVVGGV